MLSSSAQLLLLQGQFLETGSVMSYSRGAGLGRKEFSLPWTQSNSRASSKMSLQLQSCRSHAACICLEYLQSHRPTIPPLSCSSKKHAYWGAETTVEQSIMGGGPQNLFLLPSFCSVTASFPCIDVGAGFGT